VDANHTNWWFQLRTLIYVCNRWTIFVV
jgi:hypothetical protein